MIIEITSDSGHIYWGGFSLLWENAVDDLPGFLAIGSPNYSLEFGDIDNGNGVFLTKYGQGDIEYSKQIIKL